MFELRPVAFRELVDLVSVKVVPTRKDIGTRCVNLDDVPEGRGRIAGWSPASENLSAKTLFKSRDVLFGKLRPYLRKFALAPFDGVCTTEIMVFRPKPGVVPEFVFQVVASDAFVDHNVAVSYGTKMPRTDWATASAFRLLLPSQAEQQRIAEVLTALDEEMEHTEALVKKLVSRRSGLVQECLIPAAQAAPSVPLGDVCSLITSGSRGWARYYAADGALFLRIGNLTRENPNMLLEDVVRVSVPAGGEGARTRLEPGDVLISITADLGVIGCIPDEFQQAYVNQHIALARIDDADLNKRWVAHYLGSPLGYEQISKFNDGGAKAGLNLPTIRALKIPRPPLDAQAAVVALLDAVDGEIAMEQALSTKLRMQKQGLMRDLLTSDTRVR